MTGEAKLRLHLLGGVEIYRGDGTSIRLAHPRTRELLAALGLAFPRPRSRKALAIMLYPGRPFELARGNLRTLLNRLRGDLQTADISPESVLTIEREVIGLCAETVYVDWVEFQRLARASEAADWERALEIYQGELLAGLEVDWAEAARREAHALLYNVAERLNQHWLDNAQPHRALHCLERLTRWLPTQPHWYELGLELAHRLQLPEAACYWARRARAAMESGALVATPRLKNALREADNLCQPLSPSKSTTLVSIPRALDRFWGRTRELETLQAHLETAFTRQSARLIELIGAPGVGKTRLALEVAYRFQKHSGLSVLFVSLRGIQQGQSLVEYIFHFLHSLRLPEYVLHATLPKTLQQYQPLLLILDNFESAPAESAHELTELLQDLPSVVCIVTARRRLNVRGEMVFRVRPLRPPHAFDPSNPALGLLLDRSGVRRGDALAPAEQIAAVTICQLMEGNPLGLEIVASWATMLSLEQIAELLRQGELWQGEENPLHAAIRQTLHTLAPAERDLLLQLSLFEGRFHLGAVRAITGAPNPHTLLRALHDAALIEEEAVERLAHGATTLYYYMFEAVRSVCAEHLDASRREQFLQRHARYYLQLAEQIDQRLYWGDAPASLHQLDLEMGNLNRALRFLWESRQDELGLRLTLGLRHYWYLRGLYREGDEWLGRYLTLPKLFSAERARLQAWQALMRSHQHGMEAGNALFQQAFADALQSGDALALRETIACYALSALYNRDTDALRFCCYASLDAFNQSDHPLDPLLRLLLQAWLAADADDYATAQTLGQQARREAQQHQYHFLECLSLITLGLYARSPDATALLYDALHLAQTHGYLPLESLIHRTLNATLANAEAS